MPTSVSNLSAGHWRACGGNPKLVIHPNHAASVEVVRKRALTRAPTLALGIVALGLAGLPPLAPSACDRLGLAQSGERAILARRVEKLRQLVDRSRVGPLLGEHDVVFVMDQRVIAEILKAHLPWEEVVADRFRVRIVSVVVECEDGVALLRMEGQVSATVKPSPEEFAVMRLFGEVAVVELDDATGTLKGRVSLLAFEAWPSGALASHPATRRLAQEFSRLRIGAFAAFARPFEMPVRLEREIVMPASRAGGTVTFPGGRLVVSATVADVLAYDGRLWVAFRADVRGRTAMDRPPGG